MMETIVTFVIGARSMFAEGVVATLERGRLFVERRSTTVCNLPLEDYASIKQSLFVLIRTGEADIEGVCHDMSRIRRILPTAKIVIIREEVAVPDDRLCDVQCDAFIQCPLEPQALLKVIDLVFTAPFRLVIFPQHDRSGTRSELFARSFDRAIDPPIQEPLPSSGGEALAALLSKREHDILAGLSRGEANKHIARSLDISEATVKAHVRSILQKLGAENRTQAAVRLLEGGARPESY